MKFSQKMRLYLVHTMMQKSQKWSETQIKGGGSCLKLSQEMEEGKPKKSQVVAVMDTFVNVRKYGPPVKYSLACMHPQVILSLAFYEEASRTQ